jgi:hypothetical protein
MSFFGFGWLAGVLVEKSCLAESDQGLTRNQFGTANLHRQVQLLAGGQVKVFYH